MPVGFLLAVDHAEQVDVQVTVDEEIFEHGIEEARHVEGRGDGAFAVIATGIVQGRVDIDVDVVVTYGRELPGDPVADHVPVHGVVFQMAQHGD